MSESKERERRGEWPVRGKELRRATRFEFTIGTTQEERMKIIQTKRIDPIYPLCFYGLRCDSLCPLISRRYLTTDSTPRWTSVVQSIPREESDRALRRKMQQLLLISALVASCLCDNFLTASDNYGVYSFVKMNSGVDETVSGYYVPLNIRIMGQSNWTTSEYKTYRWVAHYGDIPSGHIGIGSTVTKRFVGQGVSFYWPNEGAKFGDVSADYICQKGAGRGHFKQNPSYKYTPSLSFQWVSDYACAIRANVVGPLGVYDLRNIASAGRDQLTTPFPFQGVNVTIAFNILYPVQLNGKNDAAIIRSQPPISLGDASTIQWSIIEDMGDLTGVRASFTGGDLPLVIDLICWVNTTLATYDTSNDTSHHITWYNRNVCPDLWGTLSGRNYTSVASKSLFAQDYSVTDLFGRLIYWNVGTPAVNCPSGSIACTGATSFGDISSKSVTGPASGDPFGTTTRLFFRSQQGSFTLRLICIPGASDVYQFSNSSQYSQIIVDWVTPGACPARLPAVSSSPPSVSVLGQFTYEQRFQAILDPDVHALCSDINDTFAGYHTLAVSSDGTVTVCNSTRDGLIRCGGLMHSASYQLQTWTLCGSSSSVGHTLTLFETLSQMPLFNYTAQIVGFQVVGVQVAPGQGCGPYHLNDSIIIKYNSMTPPCTRDTEGSFRCNVTSNDGGNIMSYDLSVQLLCDDPRFYSPETSVHVESKFTLGYADSDGLSPSENFTTLALPPCMCPLTDAVWSLATRGRGSYQVEINPYDAKSASLVCSGYVYSLDVQLAYRCGRYVSNVWNYTPTFKGQPVDTTPQSLQPASSMTGAILPTGGYGTSGVTDSTGGYTQTGRTTQGGGSSGVVGTSKDGAPVAGGEKLAFVPLLLVAVAAAMLPVWKRCDQAVTPHMEHHQEVTASDGFALIALTCMHFLKMPSYTNLSIMRGNSSSHRIEAFIRSVWKSPSCE
ncbi:hypothetical protein PROFUN_13717 [Planoprotostelium fungivorum]|uniref:Uncharacterized protein n=1 Tax=Planoprotostelium fungivorum TaxID=1890364 RepID=A0A2P6N3A0_9EUKA|nr:hypothetical protein PROFUN_13717 [Planoprotostelium fungivorum]